MVAHRELRVAAVADMTEMNTVVPKVNTFMPTATVVPKKTTSVSKTTMV